MMTGTDAGSAVSGTTYSSIATSPIKSPSIHSFASRGSKTSQLSRAMSLRQKWEEHKLSYRED